MSILVLSLVLSFMISFLLCPLIIKMSKKHGWYDPVNERKLHSGNIPRLGGIAIFSSYIISVAFYVIFMRPESALSFVLIGVGSLVIFVVGLLDDFFDLPAKLKLVFQIVAALCVACSPFYYENFAFAAIPEWAGRVLTFVWTLLLMNAYNLIDGLDWLCGGLSFLSFALFAIVAYLNNSAAFPFILLLITCLSGFMYWNKPTAKIFLGDSGSQTLGYAISVIPLLITENNIFNSNKILIALLVSSIPTIDVLSAILRRLREHRNIFSADRAHLHHKLLNIGFTKISAIVLLFIIQSLISIIICLSLFMKTLASFALLLVTYVLVFGFFICIHYINRSVNRKFKGKLCDVSVEEKEL